jgi:chromosome segregation ATPase
MLTTKNLEKLIELETSLRAEYQVQLDAKSAEIETGTQKQEEQKAVIARQLEQITTLSAEASSNKRMEQLNRELESRSEKLQEEVATQKGRIKALQKDLAEERAEIKTLKQLDAASLKKNLHANKKKLAEKTTANDLLQKSVNKYKSENAELQQKVKELEARLAELEPAEQEEEKAAA